MENIVLNCRAMMWPRDFESVLEMATSRIQIRRDKAEKVLRKKRVIFETKLEKHQKQLDLFKKKDPPMLTMEEMEESVELIEEIVSALQVHIFIKSFRRTL